jgi:hypothetical protein
MEAVGGKHLFIGIRVTHPDGRKVEIVDGQYHGIRGSNFWSWREVLPSGLLSKKLEHGGWRTDESVVGVGRSS